MNAKNIDFKANYLTHGNWHNSIKSFLHQTQGDYLEIGVFWGGFLAELGLTFPNKQIYGIDPFISDGYTGQPARTVLIEIEKICRNNIADISNITLFKHTTENFLQNENLNFLNDVTCVLIDGSHHYNDIKIDIELIKKINNKHLKFVVFDDIGIPDVVKAIEDFKIEFKKRIKQELEPGQFYFI